MKMLSTFVQKWAAQKTHTVKAKGFFFVFLKGGKVKKSPFLFLHHILSWDGMIRGGMDVTNPRLSQWFPPYLKKTFAPFPWRRRKAYTTLQRDILPPTQKKNHSAPSHAFPSFFLPGRDGDDRRGEPIFFFEKKNLPKSISGKRAEAPSQSGAAKRPPKKKKTLFTFFSARRTFSKQAWMIHQQMYFFLSSCLVSVLSAFSWLGDFTLSSPIKKPYPSITREEYFANRHKGKKKERRHNKKNFPLFISYSSFFSLHTKESYCPQKKENCIFRLDAWIS